jgi:hypothetical protein
MAVAGRHTFSVRQSSDLGMSSICLQEGPNLSAFTAVHGLGGCGMRQRKAPTGGAA